MFIKSLFIFSVLSCIYFQFGLSQNSENNLDGRKFAINPQFNPANGLLSVIQTTIQFVLENIIDTFFEPRNPNESFVLRITHCFQRTFSFIGHIFEAFLNIGQSLPSYLDTTAQITNAVISNPKPPLQALNSISESVAAGIKTLLRLPMRDKNRKFNDVDEYSTNKDNGKIYSKQKNTNQNLNIKLSARRILNNLDPVSRQTQNNLKFKTPDYDELNGSNSIEDKIAKRSFGSLKFLPLTDGSQNNVQSQDSFKVNASDETDDVLNETIIDFTPNSNFRRSSNSAQVIQLKDKDQQPNDVISYKDDPNEAISHDNDKDSFKQGSNGKSSEKENTSREFLESTLNGNDNFNFKRNLGSMSQQQFGNMKSENYNILDFLDYVTNKDINYIDYDVATKYPATSERPKSSVEVTESEYDTTNQVVPKENLNLDEYWNSSTEDRIVSSTPVINQVPFKSGFNKNTADEYGTEKDDINSNCTSFRDKSSNGGHGNSVKVNQSECSTSGRKSNREVLDKYEVSNKSATTQMYDNIDSIQSENENSDEYRRTASKKNHNNKYKTSDESTTNLPETTSNPPKDSINTSELQPIREVLDKHDVSNENVTTETYDDIQQSLQSEYDNSDEYRRSASKIKYSKHTTSDVSTTNSPEIVSRPTNGNIKDTRSEREPNHEVLGKNVSSNKSVTTQTYDDLESIQSEYDNSDEYRRTASEENHNSEHTTSVYVSTTNLPETTSTPPKGSINDNSSGRKSNNEVLDIYEVSNESTTTQMYDNIDSIQSENENSDEYRRTTSKENHSSEHTTSDVSTTNLSETTFSPPKGNIKENSSERKPNQEVLDKNGTSNKSITTQTYDDLKSDDFNEHDEYHTATTENHNSKYTASDESTASNSPETTSSPEKGSHKEISSERKPNQEVLDKHGTSNKSVTTHMYDDIESIKSNDRSEYRTARKGNERSKQKNFGLLTTKLSGTRRVEGRISNKIATTQSYNDMQSIKSEYDDNTSKSTERNIKDTRPEYETSSKNGQKAISKESNDYGGYEHESPTFKWPKENINSGEYNTRIYKTANTKLLNQQGLRIMGNQDNIKLTEFLKTRPGEIGNRFVDNLRQLKYNKHIIPGEYKKVYFDNSDFKRNPVATEDMDIRRIVKYLNEAIEIRNLLYETLNLQDTDIIRPGILRFNEYNPVLEQVGRNLDYDRQLRQYYARLLPRRFIR